MRAVCIKEGLWNQEGHLHTRGPKYGERVTIVGVYDVDKYRLKEYFRNPVNGREDVFVSKFFIPLSSIDETEMERNYQNEKV